MPQSKKHIPQTSEITLAMQLAGTSVEASQYLVERLTDILTQNKILDKSVELLDKVKEFAKYVEFKFNATAQPWSGQAPSASEFINMQVQIAQEAIKSIEENDINEYKLDIAINDSAEILRGYSSEGKAIADPILVDSLDKIFNAWLAQNNIISNGSILYQTNSKGEIRRDDKGHTTVNPMDLKKLLNDPEKGLVKYAKDRNLTVQIDSSHVYPAPTQAETKALEHHRHTCCDTIWVKLFVRGIESFKSTNIKPRACK